MTTEKNSNENLGYSEYRNHSAYSQSDLKYLHSPKLFHYKKMQPYDEDETKPPWFRIGDLFDKYLLSGDEFYKTHIVRPEMETPSSGHHYKFVNKAVILLKEKDDVLNQEDIIAIHKQVYAKRSKEKHLEEGTQIFQDLSDYINFQIISEGKEIISKDEEKKLKNMYHSCYDNKVIKNLIISPEEGLQTFSHLRIVNMELFGIRWKGEIDHLVIDTVNKIIYIIDLKTTSSYVAYFPTSYKKYKYYKQQALYEQLVIWWLTTNGYIKEPTQWRVHSRIVAVETSNLHEARCFPIPSEIISQGLTEIKEDADKIKYYEKHGWSNTISYNENEGLEIADWNETFELDEDSETDDN